MIPRTFNIRCTEASISANLVVPRVFCRTSGVVASMLIKMESSLISTKKAPIFSSNKSPLVFRATAIPFSFI